MKLFLVTILISTLAVGLSASVISSRSRRIHHNEFNVFKNDLSFIFEQASIQQENGKYIIDKEKIAEKFGAEAVPSIMAFIKLVNKEILTSSDLVNVPIPTQFLQQSWLSCVTDSVIEMTGIGFLTGGMQELIKKELWEELAKEIIKVVGKNAIKGGVVGFAASMAWYSVKCIGD